ncbi:MAG TPA: BBP7 family outer membrane beta-barrel protein [Planctomycetia bacterium]|nr:BBP7 family outer membrane beta-barrel protein [Planctomycetia bacterium]
MAAHRILSAVGGFCLAAGIAVGQAPEPLPGAPFTGSHPPLAAPGPGMLPQAGPLHLQSPPGDPGLMAIPGPGPQDAGRPIGNNPGEVPGVPQAWAMSNWNPVPKLVIRTEVMFLKPDFQQSRPLALQAAVNEDGQFELAGRGVDPQTDYFVTPRLLVEWWKCDQWSVEASGWSLIGPNRTTFLGNNDFPYFLDAVTVGGETFGPALTGIPAGFPTIADFASVKYRQNISNIEMLVWRHWVPDKGAASDFALGFGPRYMWMRENVTVRYEDQLPGSTTPFGELSTRTNNDLYGVEFAMKATLQSPIKWLRSSVDAKIGLMNADSRHSTSVIDTTGTEVSSGRFFRANFAGLFEAKYDVEIFLSQFVTIFGGFHVMYVDRVERASEQFNPNLNAFVQPQEQISDVLLYGPRFGLVMHW